MVERRVASTPVVKHFGAIEQIGDRLRAHGVTHVAHPLVLQTRLHPAYRETKFRGRLAFHQRRMQCH